MEEGGGGTQPSDLDKKLFVNHKYPIWKRGRGDEYAFTYDFNSNVNFIIFFQFLHAPKKVGSQLLDSTWFICICICKNTPPNSSCYVLAKIVFTYKQAPPGQLN